MRRRWCRTSLWDEQLVDEAPHLRLSFDGTPAALAAACTPATLPITANTAAAPAHAAAAARSSAAAAASSTPAAASPRAATPSLASALAPAHCPLGRFRAYAEAYDAEY